MSNTPPTQPAELAAWFQDEDENLRDKLGVLISNLSDSEEYTATLSGEDFQAFKALVRVFSDTRDEGVLTLAIQLIYACCVLIPGAVSEFFRSGGLQHSRVLLAQLQDSEVIQTLLHLVNVCFSPNTTHMVTLPEREIPDLPFIQILLTITNNFDQDIAKIAVTIMLHIHCEFSAQAGNLVLDALKRYIDAQEFATTLVMVLNRASSVEDAELVLQFLGDLFADSRFKDFFFASDLKVMIDVILREMDGEFEEDRQVYYLYMMTLYGALRESSFKETRYRHSDIKHMLVHLSTGVLADKRTGLLAGNIALEFAELLRS